MVLFCVYMPGFLVFVSLVITSVLHGDAPYLAGFALVGSIVSTGVGMALLHPSSEHDDVTCDPTVSHGLCGYDGGMSTNLFRVSGFYGSRACIYVCMCVRGVCVFVGGGGGERFFHKNIF